MRNKSLPSRTPEVELGSDTVPKALYYSDGIETRYWSACCFGKRVINHDKFTRSCKCNFTQCLFPGHLRYS